MASVTTVIPPKVHMNGTYTFASLPRALVLQRRRLRDYSKGDDSTNRQSGSISTRRSGRGKTVPWAAWTTTISPEIPEFKDSQPTRIAISRRHEHLRKSRTAPSKHPPEGRKHLEIQTEVYLEELTDTIEETDAICQTEEYLERSIDEELIQIPSEIGINVGTQIDEGELFDFDMESQPVLDVLVGKTVQHALIEVLQEEDVADIKRQRRRFEQLRKAYVAGENWLKEQEQKILDEFSKEKPANGKILDGNVLNALHLMNAWGYISDPIEKDLERAFLPWVLDEVEGELNQPTTNGLKTNNETNQFFWCTVADPENGGNCENGVSFFDGGS